MPNSTPLTLFPGFLGGSATLVGKPGESQRIFQKAHRLSPDISDEVDALSAKFWEAKKIDELLVLAQVSLELSQKLPQKGGESSHYLNWGQKELATKYFR